MRIANWIKIIVVLFAFVAPARAGAEGAASAAAPAIAAAASDTVGRTSNANAVSDCDCPKLSCNFECEYEQSVTFYSEKCASGTKVRSCARPTCLALPSAPPSCSAKAETAPARDIASVKPKESPSNNDAIVVGEVSQIEGQAWLIAGPQKVPLVKGSPVHETDKVATGEKSKLEISFKDGNSITLTPNSVLEISKINFNEDIQKRNTLLNLLKGKVRSKVGQKYLGNDDSHFRVKTRAAVAGVRGTDFVVTLDQINEDLVTKVDTMTGEVELESPLKKHKAVVAKKQTVTYVAKGLANVGAVSDEIEAEFASRGKMSEVSNLKDEQINVIDRETTANYVAAARKPAAKNQKICSAPEGQFNQCSWTCENNPKGERRCRTDLPGTNCVRRVCNANGVWSSSARLPAAFADSCDPEKVIVDSCGDF